MLTWAENIEAFGGDKDKVTIWGESAGAMSVTLLVMAYSGHNSGLFRGGIVASGNVFAPIISTYAAAQTKYNTLANATGCHYSSDSLQCLRDCKDSQYYLPRPRTNEA